MTPMTTIPFTPSKALAKYHKAKVKAFESDLKAYETFDKAQKAWLASDDNKKWHELGIGTPEGKAVQERSKTYKAMTKASRDRSALSNKNHEKLKKLAEPVDEAEMKRYYAAWKAHYFAKEGKDAKTHMSPTGQYRLVVTSQETSPGAWRYTKGTVYWVASGTPVATICRNYSAFPFSWVENHPDGHDYLVCGEDYQGQTVVQLDTGGRVDHKPASASQGFGFCWAKHWPSPDKTMLAVSGCYWACPYEMRVYDFSEPMNPPWPMLTLSNWSEFGGWNEDNTCTFGREVERIKLPGHELDGKDYNRTTPEEDDALMACIAEHELDEDEVIVEEVETKENWSRPQWADIARAQLTEFFAWRREQGLPPHADLVTDLRVILDKLSEPDRAALEEDDLVGDLLEWALEYEEAA